MNFDENKLRRELLAIGIVSYCEQRSLIDVAKQCFIKYGFAMGGAGLVMGSSIGSVTVPIIGSIPGSVAGFLAGAASGTAICVGANYGVKNELQKLLN
ncbi:hypothetical protein [Alteromonas sp. ASW11-130]|uniref:hypothetical protein n=1 Tax=Alteromonas sp. ASW11-130 TaxID=3015775 RepID=UPI00224275DD|nr:hypothetical protein [Alteromonas sp. ASW11-130]MCW8090321.1 hypothetical protein [Alteromonas sp. ASW11-130]